MDKKHFEKNGIKWSGGNYGTDMEYLTPPIYTNSSGTSPTEQQLEIMNSVIPKHLAKQDTSGGKFEGIIADTLDVAHTGNKYSQTVYNAFKNIQGLDLDGSYKLASFDIESLGTPGKTSKMFSITELAMTNWEINKQLKTKMTKEALSLVGYLDTETRDHLRSLINNIQSGKLHPYSLSPDERRSLRDLLKYKDSTMFSNNPVAVAEGLTKDMNIFKPGTIKLPLGTFNPADYAKELAQSLNNLERFSNAPDNIALALNWHMGQTQGIIGHNIMQFDLPVVADYFSTRGGESGKNLARTVKDFVRGKNKRIVLDTQSIIEYAFPNLVGEVSNMVDSSMRDTYIKSRSGQLTAALLGRSFGLGKQTHLALDDTKLPPMFLDKMSDKIYKSLADLNTIKVNNITKGRRFISTSGLSPWEVGEFDSIYSKNEGRYRGAYNDWFKTSRGGLYKNTVYEVRGLDYISGDKNPFGHQFGTHVLSLFNTDDSLVHTFIREENAAGTGISSIEEIFHRHMMPLGKTPDPYLDMHNKRLGLEDKAMRRYRKLFEAEGSYDQAKHFYEASVGKDEAKFNTSAQKRDFGVIKDRLAVEYRGFMQDIFTDLDTQIAGGTMTKAGAKTALISLRNIMEGREIINGVTVPSSYGVISTMPGARAVDMSNGILKLGSRQEIIASLRSLSNNASGIEQEGIIRLIDELHRRGYLTPEEAEQFRGWASMQSKKTNVIKALADTLSHRTNMAEQLSAVSVNDAIYKQVFNLNRDFQAIHINKSGKSWVQAWGDISKEQRSKVKEHIYRVGQINSREALINFNPYRVNIFGSASADLKNLITNHDAMITKQLSWANGNIAKPNNIINRLNDLATAYTRTGTGVRFVKGVNDNLIDIVVFRKSQAKALDNLSPNELLARRDVVTMHIPLADKNGLLTVERQRRINRMFLEMNESKNGLMVKTGVDKIIDQYMFKANRVVELLSAQGSRADMQEWATTARNTVNMGFNDVYSKLSGIGATEIGEQARFRKSDMATLSSMKWRNKILDISGAAEYLYGKKISELKTPAERKLFQMNAARYLEERTGIRLNAYSTKESWFDDYILASDDIRKAYAFSEFSPVTSQIYVQNLNINQVNPKGLEARMLNPLVTTAYGEEFFGIGSGGVPGGINARTAYITPYNLSQLLDERELNQTGERLSTYDGRSIISRRLADNLTRTDIHEFLVESSTLNKKIKIGATIGRDTIIGDIVKDGVVTKQYTWDKLQNLTITDISTDSKGRAMVVGYREIPATNSVKIGDRGDKTTATIAERNELQELFGEVDYVKARAAEKKLMHGEILNSQAALIMDEINKTVTLGQKNKEQILASVVDAYNDFFKVKDFRLGNYQGQNYLIVPESMSIAGAKFNYSDLANEVYVKINRTVSEATGQDFGLIKKLSGSKMVNGSLVTWLYGMERVGTSPQETWEKAGGFRDKGIVKFGPKTREILAMQGLEKTSEALYNLVKEDNLKRIDYAFNREGRRGLTSKYFDALSDIATGATSNEDVYVRLGRLTDQGYEVGIEEFDRVRKLDPTEVNTIARYRGSFHDLESVANANIKGVGLTSDIAQQALKQGSVVLELPAEFLVGGQVRNSIRLAMGDPRAIEGSKVVGLDPLAKASGEVFSAVQNYLRGEVLNPGKDMGKLYNAVQAKLDAYSEEIAKGIGSSKGWIQENVLSGRLKGSGQFIASAFDPFQKIAGKEVPSGVVAVTEDYFKQLFSGHKEYESLRKLATWEQVAKGEEAVYGIVGRFPLTSQWSNVVSKIVVDDSIGESRMGKITIGDLVRAAGDSDGDRLSIVVSHYKLKNENLKTVLDELKTNYARTIDERTSVDRIIRNQARFDPGYSISTLDKFTNRTGFDREAVFARVIRSDIGEASNLNTSMRRIGGMLVKNSSEFTQEDFNIISNLGELLEQAPTSGKHTSYDAILKSIGGSLDAVTADQHAEVLARLDKYITLGSEMREAVVSGDKLGFINANRSLQVFDPSATRSELNEILAGGDPRGKLGTRQRYTLEEYWGARDKLFDLSGGIDRSLKALGTKTGVTDPVKLYNLIYGSNQVSTMLSELRSAGGLNEEDILERNKQILFNRADQLRGAFNPASLPEGMTFTVGNGVLGEVEGSMGSVTRIAGLGKGMAALGGLMLAGGIIAGSGLSDKVDHDIAIGEAGYAAQIPVANPPGPTARIVENGSGYDNINISIKARDMAGMSQEEIGSMIQNEISSMMPMDVNFNITKRDNGQKLDSIWVQNVMNNAISKGYGY